MGFARPTYAYIDELKSIIGIFKNNISHKLAFHYWSETKIIKKILEAKGRDECIYWHLKLKQFREEAIKNWNY